MVSSIGGSGTSAMMQMQRPDPSKMASKLFAKLDTKNQGYIEQSDLQAAFDKVSGSDASKDSTSVGDLFKQLDSDGDGKVTKNEFADQVSKLAQELDSQFNSMRMRGGGRGGQGGMGGPGGMGGGMGGPGGMPPPPPGAGAGNAGFTKDELQSQLSESGSSDSQRSSLISNVIDNFDAADTDGDGKVSFQEAMALERASRSSEATGTSASTVGAAANSDAGLMQKIMQIARAYGAFDQDSSQSSLTSTLSVSA